MKWAVESSELTLKLDGSSRPAKGKKEPGFEKLGG